MTGSLRTRNLAGEPGFEPEPRGPEPRVLPLDYYPVAKLVTKVTNLLTDLLTTVNSVGTFAKLTTVSKCLIRWTTVHCLPTGIQRFSNGPATIPACAGTSKTGQKIQSPLPTTWPGRQPPLPLGDQGDRGSVGPPPENAQNCISGLPILQWLHPTPADAGVPACAGTSKTGQKIRSPLSSDHRAG